MRGKNYAAWCGLALLGVCLSALPTRAQTKWTQPTDEELKMTSQPQVPGAAAVYLYREEETDDLLHVRSVYVRLKILTEAGKALGDVRLTFLSDLALDDPDLNDLSEDVTDIAGRTIHSDGTVIPFTGQPFERTVEKESGTKISEKVFSLPDVQVGSILEYRFKLRTSDELYETPQWLVQQHLYVRKAYYRWKASDIFTEDSPTRGLAWSSVLPPGAAVKSSAAPQTTTAHAYHLVELEVHDVPPIVRAAYMPPMRSLSYRVNFYRAAYRTQDEFWREKGKLWAKDMEHFIGPPQSMAAQVQTLVAPGDSDTAKLQKIYAAIMAMDNTAFSRGHSEREDKAQGLSKVRTAQDIWQRKRGRPMEMAGLFVALARSAGIKAYLMAVTDRNTDIFSPAWLTLEQFNGIVAIAVVDGKEQFFDPGQRYCPFGQLAWKHTGTGGLRETDGGGAALATTPTPPYLQSQTQRVADLTLAEDGTAQGTVTITLLGSPALSWRQLGLLRDETSVTNHLRAWVHARLPEGMEVRAGHVENLADYEKPLVVKFDVRGTLATMTAKRMLLPGALFESRSRSLFPEETRSIPVYFNHGARIVDAVRVKYPADMTLESAPKDDHLALLKFAVYQVKAESQPGQILLRRTYDLGSPFFAPAEYPDVHAFFTGMANDDQRPVVLLRATAAAAGQ